MNKDRVEGKVKDVAGRIERQAGEWILDGGYAGEVVTKSTGTFQFSPERGMARCVLLGNELYLIP